jgi:tRNA pseudouridine-54 N-methylase
MEVDSGLVSGSLQENSNAALSKYEQIGQALKSDECVREVCGKLLSITCGDFPESGFVDSPFIFLEGSSGSGKSRMGFAIKSNIRSSRDVYYFLFGSPGPGSQKIYLNFENISTLFSKCYEADTRLYSKSASSPTCGLLFQESLFVYGFLHKLLSDGPRLPNVKIAPKTGKDIRNLMLEKNMEQKRPVFILDECIAISQETLKKVRFVRNCFRSLGFGLVMLGTDSGAAKLASHIGDSSRSEFPLPCCFVIGRFPPVDLSLTGLPTNAPTWLKLVLENSRPLFTQLVSTKVRDFPCDFDALLKKVFQEVIQVKRIFGNYCGQLGQLRLFQNAHYPLKDWNNNQSTPLIHSHFAQLDGPEKNFVLLNDGCVSGTYAVWKPCSVFPKLEDDILLYLLLMGGKDYPAFLMSDGKQVPYAHFLMNVRGDSDCRSHILDFSNAVQRNNDGMFLESLLCSTVCLASHSNGIQGITLQKFLLNLVYQLQIGKIDCSDVSIAGLERLDQMNLTIPFLSPPNQDWPEFFKVPGSNLGFLSRTRNSKGIDLWVSSGLAGESKDYGSDINLHTMRNILKRIPENANLELIFTRRLQKSYFTKALSFEDEFQSSHLMNRSYYKIDASNPITSLESIDNLTVFHVPGSLRVELLFSWRLMSLLLCEHNLNI